MTTSIIACEVIREELLSILGDGHCQHIEFVSMGLHISPAKLRVELQSRILAHQHRERIVLGFGLCGESLAGLCSPKVPLVIPRVADCIPLLLGSTSLHRATQLAEKGTFYLSGGWVEGERNLLAEHERVVRKFGERTALKVLNTMLAPYRRLLFIRTGHPREDECFAKASHFANVAGLTLESVRGDVDWLARLVHGPWSANEFATVMPNDVTSADIFNDTVPSCSDVAGSQFPMRRP